MLKARPCQGSTLLTALFITVFLSLMVAMMLRIFDMDMAQQSLYTMHAQARGASISALEWAKYQVENGNFCDTADENATLILSSDSYLNAFTTEVSCTLTEHTAGGTTLPSRWLVVTTSKGTYGHIDYITKTITDRTYHTA